MVSARLSRFRTQQREQTIFASAARVETVNSADQRPPGNVTGVRLHLDITAVSGAAPTLDVKVQSKDPASGKYFDILGAAFRQHTAVGDDALSDVFDPFPYTFPITFSRFAGSPIPRTWRVVATIGGTTPSFTFSLGATYSP